MNIKKWDGNLDNLHNLIKRSWGIYLPNFINFNNDINYYKWFLEYPENKNIDHYCCYQDKEMIAFVGLNKRKYKFKNSIKEGFYISLLTIDPDYNGQTIGKVFISEVLLNILEKSIKTKNDLPLICFHSSIFTNDNIIFKDILKTYNVYVNNISSFSYDIKAIDVEKMEHVLKLKLNDKIYLSSNKIEISSSSNKNIIFYNNSYLNDCYQLYNESIKNIDFCPVWSKKELEYYLKYKNISDTLIFFKNNKVTGFINYRFVTLFRKNMYEKFAVIQWFSEKNLTESEKKLLLNKCFEELENQNCSAVLFQNVPLFSESILHNYNFLPDFRKINFCCYSFEENDELDNNKNSYEIII